MAGAGVGAGVAGERASSEPSPRAIGGISLLVLLRIDARHILRIAQKVADAAGLLRFQAIRVGDIRSQRTADRAALPDRLCAGAMDGFRVLRLQARRVLRIGQEVTDAAALLCFSAIRIGDIEPQRIADVASMSQYLTRLPLSRISFGGRDAFQIIDHRTVHEPVRTRILWAAVIAGGIVVAVLAGRAGAAFARGDPALEAWLDFCALAVQRANAVALISGEYGIVRAGFGPGERQYAEPGQQGRAEERTEHERLCRIAGVKPAARMSIALSTCLIDSLSFAPG